MQSLRPRGSRLYRVLDVVIFLLYLAILCLAIVRHEPWADEAQAWLIARDCSLGEIFLHRLHYEGTPGLWSLLLWLLARLHVSYFAMHWVAGALTAAGVFLLLRYSPLPRPLRILLPFTLFLQYQFAVVARSYGLFTLGVFCIAALFCSRRPRPLLFALACGMVANTSLFGLCAALGFFLIYFYPRLKLLRGKEQSGRPRLSTLMPSIWCFSALFLIAVYTAVPTPDGSFGPQASMTGKGAAQHLLSAITFNHEKPQPVAPALAKPLSRDLVAAHASASASDRLWRTIKLRENLSPGRLLFSKVVSRIYTALCILTYPISSSNLLAMAFFISMIVWLMRRKQLFLLVPYGLVFCFSVIVMIGPHNIGVLWVLIVAALWIALAQDSAPETRNWLDYTLFSLSFLVIAGQIVWTVATIRRDLNGSYDGAELAAKYLRAFPPGTHIASFNFDSVSIEPYFSHNIFENQPASYWLWSKAHDPNRDFTSTMQRKPDLIVLSEIETGDEQIKNQWFDLNPSWINDSEDIRAEALNRFGYIEMKEFCGETFIRFGAERRVCHVVFSRGGIIPLGNH